ncbi:MAG: hypothetical protein IT376_13865 [Polyangiaceae bacterium]|nr:hypothetical protein [Polyangiaceae bacterium]
MRWPSGFEQLGCIALVFACLLAVDRGARGVTDGPAARWGWALAALSLASAGVMVKAPVITVVVPAALLWGRWVVPRPVGIWRTPWIYLALLAVVAAPLGARELLSGGRLGAGGGSGAAVGDPFAIGGGSKVASNLWLAAIELNPSVTSVVLAVGALALAARWRGRGLVSGALRAAARQRVGSIALPAFCLVFGAVFLAPYLLNTRYFARYYVWLAWAPVCVGVAAVLGELCRAGAAPRAMLVAVAVVLLPHADLKRLFSDTAENRAPQFLANLALALEGRPEPRRMAIVADCGDERATRAAEADLERVFQFAGEKSGVHRVTRWRRAEIVCGDARDADLRVRYCGAAPLVVESP